VPAQQRLQRNGRLQRKPIKALQCAQSQSRRQKAHRTLNSDCLVHHRTVRWPRLSELQRSNPNGWVTDSLPNGHFGGWGYKYPPTTTLQGIQVFSHCIQYKSSRLHSKTQNKRSNPLQVPISSQRLSGLCERERDLCSFEFLSLGSLFFFPFLFSRHL
jgi:hypothetical protein